MGAFEHIIDSGWTQWEQKNWEYFANDMFSARMIMPWEVVDGEYDEMHEQYFRYQG